jgi:hypothetical protein
MKPHYTGATCPHCNRPVPLTAGADGEAAEPEDGDVAICIKCGGWSVFTEDLQMRKPTEHEARELAKDEAVREADRAWRAMKAVEKHEH